MSKGKDKKTDNVAGGNGHDHTKPSEQPQVGDTKPVFAIQRIYVKHSAFDAPQIANLFEKNWTPKLDVNVQTTNHKLTDNRYEVVLTITVDAKVEDDAIFSVTVKQAGLFLLNNFTQDQLSQIFGTECLKILFPYAREAITDVSTRATLPPLYLTPLNFEAIYAEQLRKKDEKGAQA